ncbi:MAG TPA: ABC transporter permease [Pseudolabrys sp.]|nr:ABC transporter permease [Pseudolabrys sp.]
MPSSNKFATRRRLLEFAIGASPFVIGAVAWQAVSLSGRLPAVLFPDLGTILSSFVDLLTSGVLADAAIGTLTRLGSGFAIAAALGLSLGFLMGRYQIAEDFLLPVISFGYPIPSFAYAPLFVLWFGLGDTPSIMLVAIAAAFPITINTWRGVKSIKPIWIRSAQGMGATEPQILRKVILPASLAFTLVGLRLGLAQAWRILIGVEMLTAVANGLGSLIFGAQQFLNTDVMLSGIIMIGLIGYCLEKQIFERIERLTLARWGMITA